MDGRRLRGFGHGGGARRARRPFLGGGCVLFGLWGRDEVKVLVGGGLEDFEGGRTCSVVGSTNGYVVSIWAGGV